MEARLSKTDYDYIVRMERERDEAVSRRKDAELASKGKDKYYLGELKKKEKEAIKALEDKDKTINLLNYKASIFIFLLIVTGLSFIFARPEFITQFINCIIIPINWFNRLFRQANYNLTGFTLILSYIGISILILILLFLIGTFIYFYRRRWNQLTFVQLIITSSLTLLASYYINLHNVPLLIIGIQAAYLIACRICDKKLDSEHWDNIQHLRMPPEDD